MIFGISIVLNAINLFSWFYVNNKTATNVNMTEYFNLHTMHDDSQDNIVVFVVVFPITWEL